MGDATSYDTLRFVGTECVPDVLRDLCQNNDLALGAALNARAESARIAYLTERFLALNLVGQPELQISSRGRTCDCGIGLIEGESIVEVIDRLRSIDPLSNRITLVREGMTSQFIQLLHRLDPLKRIMICSPWISLGRDRRHDLMAAVERSQRQQGFYPELTVVTRALDDQPNKENNETLAYLRRIGALIKHVPNLHSKLYIVESGAVPPQRHAFVGSENFTKVRFQEVGIRINNDHQVVDDLVHYVLTLLEQG
jgi:hypothetical protein